MKKFRQLLQDFSLQYSLGCNFCYLEYGKHRYIFNAFDMVRCVILRPLLCKVFKHKWVSLDYATPDHGGIGVECTRCGESHFTYLY